MESQYFNPRAPYGARPSACLPPVRYTYFNPRAPYGARLISELKQSVELLFQSTRPIRGATYICFLSPSTLINFNPRAPYGARHVGHNSSDDLAQNFNPRAPYGARLPYWAKTFNSFKFQSTRPIRGATRSSPVITSNQFISIHAPHTGRDTTTGFRMIRFAHFNPRAPYGARHKHNK